MMNNKVIFSSILVCFFTFSCEKAQILETNDQPDRTNRIDTIKLLPTDRYVTFEKYVVLYDQSDYLIKTQLSSFLADLYSLTGYSYYPDFLTIANQVIQDATRTNKLIVSDYFNSRKQDYVLSHFLDNGNCFILNKIDNKPVPELIKETWAHFCGPLCGSGGRKFFIKDKIFLEVLDWISK